jgi:signal peptidase II
MAFKYQVFFGSLIILDQITKLIFWSRDFSVKNYGLVFSLNFGPALNLLIVATALFFLTYNFINNRKSKNREIIFSLILAGAISNILDRLYLGYVRDFIEIGLGLTFNFADLFIVAGITLLLFEKNSKIRI